jgi:predicted component of type VI protein secretion system
MVTMYRQPAATLIIRRGPDAEQQFAITEPAVTVGRHRSCDIQVDEPEVSRQHARITWSGTGYVIEDLGSVNGTFVNGERISAPRVLQDGDVIGLGSRALLAFQVSPPAHAPPRPASPSPAYAPRPPAKRRSRILVPVIALRRRSLRPSSLSPRSHRPHCQGEPLRCPRLQPRLQLR